MKETLNLIIQQCKQAGACDLLRQNMSIEEICHLIHTPQGEEFILEGIPTLNTWREANSEYKETFAKYHIYIDAGWVTPEGHPARILAVGDTYLNYTAGENKLYGIVLLHGAMASIKACNWAVVHTATDSESFCTTTRQDRAIIL